MFSFFICMLSIILAKESEDFDEIRNKSSNKNRGVRKKLIM